MKKPILFYVTIFVILTIIVSGSITFCKKNKSGTCQEKSQTRTQTIKPNDQFLTGRFFDGGDRADLSVFESTESNIDNILDSYGLICLENWQTCQILSTPTLF